VVYSLAPSDIRPEAFIYINQTNMLQRPSSLLHRPTSYTPIATTAPQSPHPTIDPRAVRERQGKPG